MAISIIFLSPTGFAGEISVIDPFTTNRAQSFKQVGDECLIHGKALAAIANYEKAVALNPNSSGTLFNLAIAYYSQSNLKATVATLEKLIQLDPTDQEVAYNLACLKLYTGDLARSRSLFERIVGSSRSSSFTLRSKQGLEFLEEVKSMSPSAQKLALFLIQMGEGLSPSPILL